MLNQYSDWDEKKAYFEYGDLCINTKKEFDEHFEKLKDSIGIDNFIFRGCVEAKYKLYTSSQRYWIENHLEKQGVNYHSFIKKLIDNCKDWNNNTLRNFFFNTGNGAINDLAYLSYMQHYGVPTPLLDFTDNPFVGLFFAIEKETQISSNDEIGQYCSLYTVNKKNEYFKGATDQFEEEIKSNGNNEEVESNQKDEENEPNQIDYEKNLAAYPILLVTENQGSYKIINNTNISNQEGLFFYNNDLLKPIEEVYVEKLNIIKDEIGIDAINENNYEEKFASCLNIHKSLRSYVLYKISTHNATDNFIYPDNNQLKQDILRETLEKI